MSVVPVDHRGVRYGKVVGISPTDNRYRKSIIWLWKCDCGQEFEALATNFVSAGHSRGCGDCVKKFRAEVCMRVRGKHLMSGTKEHKAWTEIKHRIGTHPNYLDLEIDPLLNDSFEAFYKEIGPIPSQRGRWSVGRIDNDVGYIVGNIQWETPAQQARNRGKCSNNTSGVTGVFVRRNEDGTPNSFVARWCGLDHKQHEKGFNVRKYGEELAFLAACEARDQAIRLLNQQSAGYAPAHGK